MHFSLPTLLGLVASTHAIDVYFSIFDDCSAGDGVQFACTDLPPKTCCSFDDDDGIFRSIKYANIPLDGRTTAPIVHNGPGCTSGDFFSVIYFIDDVEEYCIDAPYQVRGTSYDVWDRPERHVGDVAARDVEVECLEKRQPDTLILRDGSRYNLLGLEKKDVHAVLALAKKDATSADVPEALKTLRV
ncbi:hypothetical protein NLU13_1529 [Sarocladium strictum]|uniref:Uncharacterized protein n=1 Tax=Sarocladium strictum TaxID=5046 RepID=A0AA39GRE3_SARSR|nr:hypothetical protein NLU13_1529 [Sarocladium strictum]